MKIHSNINTASCLIWHQTTAVVDRARPLSHRGCCQLLTTHCRRGNQQLPSVALTTLLVWRQSQARGGPACLCIGDTRVSFLLSLFPLLSVLFTVDSASGTGFSEVTPWTYAHQRLLPPGENLKTGTNPYSWPYPTGRGVISGGGGYLHEIISTHPAGDLACRNTTPGISRGFLGQLWGIAG